MCAWLFHQSRGCQRCIGIDLGIIQDIIAAADRKRIDDHVRVKHRACSTGQAEASGRGVEDALNYRAAGTGNLHILGVIRVLVEEDPVVWCAWVVWRRKRECTRTGERNRTTWRRQVNGDTASCDGGGT